MPQLRDNKGRFLPKDAHIEDVSQKWWETYGVMPNEDLDDLVTDSPHKAHKGRWRVVIAYVIYLALCFGAGVLGALAGVHI